MKFTARELGTVLAALRAWQANEERGYAEIATDYGRFGELSEDEIDEFCERINSVSVQFTGHLPNSGIQAHSAGLDFPGVIYAQEFAGDAHTYWGVLYDGFDYGVFHTHADAQRLIAIIKAVRTVPDPELIDPYEYRIHWERKLGMFFTHRAAAAGRTPSQHARYIALEPKPEARDPMPVDALSTPILIRMRYGHTPAADRWLAFWGYNPKDFQTDGVSYKLDEM